MDRLWCKLHGAQCNNPGCKAGHCADARGYMCDGDGLAVRWEDRPARHGVRCTAHRGSWCFLADCAEGCREMATRVFERRCEPRGVWCSEDACADRCRLGVASGGSGYVKPVEEGPGVEVDASGWSLSSDEAWLRVAKWHLSTPPVARSHGTPRPGERWCSRLSVSCGASRCADGCVLDRQMTVDTPPAVVRDCPAFGIPCRDAHCADGCNASVHTAAASVDAGIGPRPAACPADLGPVIAGDFIWCQTLGMGCALEWCRHGDGCKAAAMFSLASRADAHPEPVGISEPAPAARVCPKWAIRCDIPRCEDGCTAADSPPVRIGDAGAGPALVETWRCDLCNKWNPAASVLRVELPHIDAGAAVCDACAYEVYRAYGAMLDGVLAN